LRKLIAAGIAVSVNTVVTNLNLTGLPELTRYLIALDIPFRYSIVKGEKIHGELLDEYVPADARFIVWTAKTHNAVCITASFPNIMNCRRKSDYVCWINYHSQINILI
jgi:MoaA/NifB/PqqE/SkfB family radical SAM enzyme